MANAPKINEALRAFVENVPLPCAALTRDLVVAAHNRGWSEVFALEGDVEGQASARFFPELPARWRETFVRVFEGGDAEAMERDELVRADGRKLWISWTVTPWREGDDARGAIVTCVDVTESVETARRSEEDAAFIQSFFSRSPIGLNLCRTDGLWLESNQAFLDIIGYSAAEADGGLTYWDLTPRKYDDDEAEQLKSLEATGRYGPYEKEFIRKDGTLVPVRLNGFFIERDGERYIWSLIEDLTAQRALETSVEQERLKAIQASKLATIGEMAAGFAHEINNPLTIIEAYAFELEEADGEPALVAEAAKAIREATQRAGTIVRGLRKLARDESGREARVEDIDELTREAVALCRARYERNGVRLDVKCEGGCTAKIHSVELLQVIINLLNNAFDAIAGREAQTVTVRTWREEARAKLSVSDSGAGVRAEDRERIFEPFFTTKDVNSGTGLGLSISRSIVEEAGGELLLEDDDEHTRFVVSLPCAGASA
jgi:PAS domain S-box-containing protein